MERNLKSLPLHPEPKPLSFLANFLDVRGGNIPESVSLNGGKFIVRLPLPFCCQYSGKVECPCLGDISRIRVFGKDTLFMNSWTAANGLLEERSAIYFDQLELVILNEM